MDMKRNDYTMDMKPKKNYMDLFKLILVTVVLGVVVFSIMFFIVLSVFSKKPNSNYKYNNQGEAIKVENESGQKINILGVIQKIDLTKNEIEITNIEKPEVEDLKLNLVGYTEIEDEYGELMVIAQVELGDIVEIAYAQESKKVEQIKLSGKVWKFNSIQNLSIDQNNKTVAFEGNTYNYNNKLVKTYKTEKILFDEITKDAIVTIKGYKDLIWSIRVEKYYGYLSFINHESYIGSDIEVDTNVFKKLDLENNIVLSPGEHKLVIKRDDIETQIKYIIIKEKETTTVDLMDVEFKRGTIVFDISENDYTINVSNNDKSYNVDFNGTQMEVLYGKYNISVSKPGYKTYTASIDVKTPTVNVRVKLQKVVDNARVKITSNIAKSEVYVDDKYVGTTPIDLSLTFGEHKIIVTSKGYTPAIKQVDIKESPKTYDFQLILENPYSNNVPGSVRDDVY